MKNFEDFLSLLNIWCRPHYSTLIFGCLFLFLGSLLMLCVPLLFGRLIVDFPKIVWKGWALLIAILSLRGIFVFFGSRMTANIAAELVCKIRRFLFKKFIYAPITFHDHNMSANLVSTITNDASFMEQMFLTFIPTLAQHGSIVLLGSIYLLIFHFRLFLLLAITGLPVIYFLLKVGKKLRRVTRLAQQNIANVAVTVQESLKGLNLIKRLVKERYFYQKFSRQIDDLFKLKQYRIKWQSIINSVLPAFMVIFAAWTIWLVKSDFVSGGPLNYELASFFVFMTIVGTSFGRLIQAYVGFEQIFGALNRIQETLPEIRTGLESGAVKLERIKGVLEIKNVSFTYSQSPAGVFDINLRFGEGEVVGLIGPNGAGKSTLIDLILRFYNPQQGQILLGGHNLNSVDIESWREQFAVLMREPYLFNVSIYENIALSSRNSTYENVIRVSKISGIHNVVQSLANGYNTVVGESGVLLSTGQRQLVALTRIFLQDPSVVILDEATVSLDQEVRQKFSQAMKDWIDDRLIIVVSHKIDKIWPYTRIVNMKNGRILSDNKFSDKE